MRDKRRLLGMSGVLAVFGLASLLRMFGRPSFEAIRAVDVVQLLGTGMCFGAAIVGFVLYLRGPRPS